MAADPTEHPARRVPEKLPQPPGTEQPSAPSEPQLPHSGPDYVGEEEDEEADPVGKPPRM